MRKRIFCFGLGAIVMCLPSACAGSNVGADRDRRTAETSSTLANVTVQPPVTTKQATIGQIASIIAKSDDSIRTSVGQIGPCRLYTEKRCDLAARLSLGTVAIRAEALAIPLEAADDPQTGLYIGAYPQELVRLVADTLGALRDLTVPGTLYRRDNCAQNQTSSCAVAATQIYLAAGNLIDQLDAWRPYL